MITVPLYSALRRRLRFYRRHTFTELTHARAYYSQYGEDIFLREYYRGKRAGFYVDVGGFHPIEYSNSHLFYRDGRWQGIVVEPNPEKSAAFRTMRPRDTLLPIAVSDEAGTATFAIDEGFSGIVDPRFFHHDRLGETRQITVQTRTLREVLDEHRPTGEPIDFLSVDCEGHDEAILRSNDWQRHRPLLVLCEAFDAETAGRLDEMLRSVRYERLGACGPTLIFEDRGERADRPERYH